MRIAACRKARALKCVDPETKAARTIVDTIADNAANAGIVLGQQRHAVDAFDLRWIGSIVKRNSEVEETGLGAGVLDDPASGIAWLTKRLAHYGEGLRAEYQSCTKLHANHTRILHTMRTRRLLIYCFL